jgi:D-alanine-D-alanine ligase
MKVTLVYDEPLDAAGGTDLPEDAGAEYEDARTIAALLDAIRACGHEAVPLAFGEDFPLAIRRLAPDLVFNIAEGVRGPARESIVPAWLDRLGVPHTGANGLALAVSLDKALTKAVVAARGVRTPASRRVRRMEDLDGLDLPFPLFVKPNAEGSSMGIRRASRVEDAAALERQVSWVLDRYGRDCLVEAFVPGREFCVGLLGNVPPKVLPVLELRTETDFYSYEDKHAHRKELVCPADIPQDLAGEMGRMGVAAWDAIGCRDLARVDLKLDEAGCPNFIEINPLPGLSPFYSVFPRQAEAAGISHTALIGAIIDSSLQRTGRLKKGTET